MIRAIFRDVQDSGKIQQPCCLVSVVSSSMRTMSMFMQ